MEATQKHIKHFKHIDQFVAYFSRQLQVVAAATFSENAEIYRKALYCSMIDALGTTLGTKGSHRDKFTKVVQLYADWPDHSRVSRPHLEKIFTRNSDSTFDDVRGALAALPPFPSFSIVPIARDTEFATLEPLWPRERKGTVSRFKRIDGLDCAMLKHEQLLYSLRNKLIHESRTHGTTIPLSGQSSPYYHRTVNLDTGTEWWALNYPSSFVENVATKVLNGLANHYRTNLIDPEDFFDYGDYWFAQLHEWEIMIIVGGHSKPASKNRMKAGHFEVSIAYWEAGAAHGHNERTQYEPAAFDLNFGGQWLVQPADCA